MPFKPKAAANLAKHRFKPPLPSYLSPAVLNLFFFNPAINQ